MLLRTPAHQRLRTKGQETIKNLISDLAGASISGTYVFSDKEGLMAGKFEYYEDKKGKFRFRLKAGNGQIIAVSEAYESKDSCINGIESVKKNAPDAPIEKVAE